MSLPETTSAPECGVAPAPFARPPAPSRAGQGARLADRHQAAVAASILADAFEADPIIDWAAAGRAARERFIHAVIAGSVQPLIDLDLSHSAAAVWVSTEPGRPPEWRSVLALPSLLLACPARLPQLALLGLSLQRHHPRRAYEYLVFLAVAGVSRRQGVGSALMARAAARLDAAGRPAFLETGRPENLNFYGRFGFEVIKEYRVYGGGPTVWSLWREPRSSAVGGRADPI